MDFFLSEAHTGQLALVDVAVVRLFPEYVNIVKTADFGETHKTVTARNMAYVTSRTFFGGWSGYQHKVQEAGEYRDQIEISHGTPLLYLGSFVGSRYAYEAHYGVMAKPIICHRFLYDEKVYVWGAQRLENSIRKYTTEQWTKIFKESSTLFRQFFKLI